MNLAARLIGGVVVAGAVGAQLASPAPLSAQGAQQVTIPAGPILNPCNGELIVTTGLQHFVVLSKGSHVLTHQNFQDVKGVGQTTQNQYVISGSSELHASVNAKTGHAVFTNVSVLHIISLSTGQNLISTIVVHSVGTKTVVHDNTRCTQAKTAALTANAASSTTAAGVSVASSANANGAATTPGSTAAAAPATSAGTLASGSPIVSAQATLSHRLASKSGVAHSNAAPGQQHSASSANAQSNALRAPTPGRGAHGLRTR